MLAMPANRTTAILLVILCLSWAGCVHLSTPAERDASFSPYKEARIGQESLWNYLIYRSGVLLSAESFDTTSTGEHSFHFTGKGSGGFGTAAAIDKRGYFLTAAHCVEQGQFRLAFLHDGKMQVEPVRIVWRGDMKKREPDLAILCVSRPIGPTFQWAAEFTNGSPVVDVGLRLDDDARNSQPQLMAGRVLDISHALSADSLGYAVVSHSSPLRPGDSGGPLVLSDGRLLGINFYVRKGFQWSHFSFEQHSEAHRPDLVWLQKVIDADAALQAMSRAD